MHRLSVSKRFPTLSIHLVIFYFSAISMLIMCTYGMYASAVQYSKTKTVIIGQVIVSTEISESWGCKSRNISNGPLCYFVVFCDEACWRKTVKYTEYHKISPTNCNSHRLCSFAVRICLQFSCLEFTYNV